MLAPPDMCEAHVAEVYIDSADVLASQRKRRARVAMAAINFVHGVIRFVLSKVIDSLGRLCVYVLLCVLH